MSYAQAEEVIVMLDICAALLAWMAGDSIVAAVIGVKAVADVYCLFRAAIRETKQNHVKNH